MKILRSLVLGLLSFSLLVSPAAVFAQNSKPILLVSPGTNVSMGTYKPVQISMVNMGVALKRVEITVRFSGEFDQKWGLAFRHLDTQQLGLTYKTHHFSNFAGTNHIKDLTIVFEANQPQGYNQGSAQIPLAEVTYLATPGTFSALIVPEKTKLTDSEGNLVPSIETKGASNFVSESGAVSPESNLQSYSLSFESDPIRKWWPTAPNSVQQIDAAIWKDSDGDNVRNFTNLGADWQVDANYLEITNTTSSFFKVCPVVTVSGRPCIMFSAHAVTKKPGQSAISLRVTDNQTGSQTWNSYPLEIFSVNEPTVTPSPMPSAASPKPQPTFIPEKRITNDEFQEIQQKVTYLQSQIDQQQAELDETQNVLDRVVNFLKRLFRL